MDRSMMTVSSIVEGDGEVAAVPVLLRRLAAHYSPDRTVAVLPPIRVRRERFLRREDELRRHLLLAGAKSGDAGWVLILLDADDDCPAHLGSDLLARAKAVLPHRRVSVVMANREYEAWFIASAASLHGHRGFAVETGADVDPERPRNAKKWIEERMVSRAYGETTDQAAFSALIDIELAKQRSRSFRKLCTEWTRQCQP